MFKSQKNFLILGLRFFEFFSEFNNIKIVKRVQYKKGYFLKNQNFFLKIIYKRSSLTW